MQCYEILNEKNFRSFIFYDALMFCDKWLFWIDREVGLRQLDNIIAERLMTAGDKMSVVSNVSADIRPT